MVNLITGHQGTAHVTAADAAAINKALYGNESAAVDFGNNLGLTLQSSNKAVISTGLYYMQGRWIRVDAEETVTVENGEAGYNRNDIVAIQYSQDAATGIETASIVIVKGNSVTGAASDPALVMGDIDNGDVLNQQALYRIPISGINVGTPVKLFSMMHIRAEVDAKGNNIADTYATKKEVENTYAKKAALGDQIKITVSGKHCTIERA